MQKVSFCYRPSACGIATLLLHCQRGDSGDRTKDGHKAAEGDVDGPADRRPYGALSVLAQWCEAF